LNFRTKERKEKVENTALSENDAIWDLAGA